MAFERTFKLAMKLKVKFALKDGEKIKLSAAPFACDGEIWIPTEACDFSFNTVKTFDGTEYGALSSVSGMYTKFDEMGLVIIDPDKSIELINRKENLFDMTTLMSSFIFELPAVKISPDYAPATEEEIKGFRMVANEVKKLGSGKRHPVIFADNDKFARLKAIYNGGKSALKGYMQEIVDKAERIISDGRAKLKADESGLESPFVCQYETPDQYDKGGRMGESSYTSYMSDLAFAYRITGKEAYAKCAYYLGVDFGKWNHWGPCHFLNCAMATRYYAIAYDWLYDAWSELGFDTNVIRAGLIKNGILPAYRSMIDDTCDWKTANPNSTGWRFKLKKDNWNAVCNCGVLIGLVSLLADGEPLSEEDDRLITTVLGGSLVTMTYDGHVLRQYAPAGDYVESNTYWSYGTNALFYGIGALHSYFGTDFGICNAPGIDKTCYYALNSESADFVGWSYHDGEEVAQDTSVFNLFATVSGDHALYSVRKLHLERGKASSRFDILYDPDLLGVEIPDLDSFPLDYCMEGIDGVVFRDGWNPGSLYTGIMGGKNPVKSSHNHIDSGSFVYHNKGRVWIADLGKDYYNITGGYFGNNKLYRRVAEGHNVVFISELPCGQQLGDGGKLTRVSFEGDKSIAVIDNAGAYGEYAASALRGMLVTNDRKTTVIQDEIVFSTPTDAYAAYHFKSGEVKAELSEDKKICILTDENGVKLSLKLITENDACFEITSCYDFVLKNTASCEGEYPRDKFSRLLVRYGKTEKIDTALVIELLSDSESGYNKIIPISEW